ADIAKDALAAAGRTGDAWDLISAHHVVGMPLFHRGHFARALQHLEQSIELYDPGAHGRLAYVVGLDRGVAAHGYAAWCHGALGHPDRPLAFSERAVSLAERVEHPISLADALLFAGSVHFERGELDRGLKRATELVGLAEQLGFPLYQGVGRFYRGFAR